MNHTRLCAVFLFAAAAIATPEQGLPTFEVKLVETRKTSLPAFNYFGWPRCESDGSIYFQSAAGSTNGPVVRISGSADRETEFRLSSSDSDTTVYDSSPAGQGQLVGLAFEKGVTVVIRYEKDGLAGQRTKLETPKHFVPDKIAVFRNGYLFVTGYIDSGEVGKNPTSFAGIFHPDGSLIKILPKDVTQGINEKGPRQFLPDAALASAEDGNLYSLSTAGVFLVTPNGEVKRQFQYSKPNEYFASRFFVSGVTASIGFVREGKNHQATWIFRTYDLSTGQVRAEYVPSADLGNAVLCFSANEGYTFIKGERGSITLVRGWVK